MTPTTQRLALTACLTALLPPGCDSDATSASEYRVVAHADLSALARAPFVTDAMKKDAFQIGGDLGPCEALVRSASAVTLGADEGAFEIYIEGKFTAKAAAACRDHVAAELRTKGTKADERFETTLVAEGLFAVHRGVAKPSRARMTALLGADPSPGKQALWMVAHDDDDKDEIEHIEAWASVAKGFDAHLTAHFDSAKAATELYGQAMLGLTALRLSGELGELAKAVSLSSGGDTITAELHASSDLVRKLMADASVRAKVDASRAPEQRGDDDHGAFSIQIEAN